MREKDFSNEVMSSLKLMGTHAFAWRANDRMTLGLPDIQGVLTWTDGGPGIPFAFECKALRPLAYDAIGLAKRTAPLLHHPFTGPQISTLRALARAGCRAYGLVRLTATEALIMRPECIPTDSGNFMTVDLPRLGSVVKKIDSRWELANWLCWSNERASS